MRPSIHLARTDRVVGLEIGDDSIRAVELHGTLIRAHAEVSLPAGSVVRGDIVDDAAVRGALKHLWHVGHLSSRTVIFGMPSEQVVARQADLPDLDAGELRSALRFEVGGVIPFPIEESILDCTEIERVPSDDGGATIARVLVVAVYRPALERWISVLKSARLAVAAIDHWAYAMLRAAGPGTLGPATTELLVDIGSDALSIMIHEAGRPRFARSLEEFSTTSSVSLELEAELDRIERFRLKLEADGTSDVMVKQYVQRDPIADAVRSTIDYLAFQPGLVDLNSIRVSGDLERARPVVAQLNEMLGLNVAIIPPLLEDPATPRLGDRIHPERDLICFGHALALSSLPFGPGRLDLLPDSERNAPKARRANLLAGAGVTVGVALLAAVAITNTPDVADRRADLANANELLGQAQAKLAYVGQANPDAKELSRLDIERTAALTGAINWTRVLTDINAVIPPDAPLVAFEGHRAAEGEGIQGRGAVTLTVQGANQTATASWLTVLKGLDVVDKAWPGATSANNGGATGAGLQTATVSATVTDAAARTADGSIPGALPDGSMVGAPAGAAAASSAIVAAAPAASTPPVSEAP